MNDIFKSDIFRDIDPSFLQRIEITLSSLQGKSDLEVIGTVMALSNEANQRGIQMSAEQQQALMLYLRNMLPPDKRQKFDLIIAMMSSK